MSQIEGFRKTRIWLEKNCPTGAKGVGQVPTGSTKIKIEDPDVTLWLDRMIEKGPLRLGPRSWWRRTEYRRIRGANRGNATD